MELKMKFKSLLIMPRHQIVDGIPVLEFIEK